MNKNRYEVCKKCIEEGRWDINLETGIVTGKCGSTGYSNGKYLMLDVSYKGKDYQFKIHEIIAIAGGLYPVDVTIDHINNKHFDNRFCNLQLLSRADNTRKQRIGNPNVKGTQHKNAKLTEEDIPVIRELLASKKYSQREIADMYGVHKSTIQSINAGKKWTHV